MTRAAAMLRLLSVRELQAMARMQVRNDDDRRFREACIAEIARREGVQR